MTKLDIKDVEHIARLSRLKLSEEEMKLYAEQLSSVLEYVGQLNEVDTSNVEPCNNVTGLINVVREDEVEESGITHDDIAQNAPEFKDGNIVVPGVFE